MSKAARRMRRWLLATGAVYALGAVDFIARPRAATGTLNSVAAGGVRSNEIEPESPPGIYNALAAAYMATIAALALSAAHDPEGERALIPPLLVAKAGSSAALLYHFSRTRKPGFAVAAGLDAFLFGTTAGLMAGLDR